MKIFDTHFHLTDQIHWQNKIFLLENFKIHNIKVMIPCYNQTSFTRIQKFPRNDPNVYLSAGMHPLFIDSDFIVEMLNDEILNSVDAIGEIGLDYLSKTVDKKSQIYAFEQQLDAAMKYSKPVIIHCVKAYGDLLNILCHFPGLQGVIHRVSTSLEIARKLWEMGFSLGFGPEILNPNHRKARVLAKITPQNRLLLETDSPYTRMPSGQISMPSDLIQVLYELASIREFEFTKLRESCHNNSLRLFGGKCLE